ncbi:MAG: hypothetical protein ACOH2J_20790 [Allorhizobium sp.]
MAIKTLLNTENKPNTAQAAFEAVQLDLCELQHDIKVMAWGCDMLWHSSFCRQDDNEFLSHLPIAILRSLASRTGQLHAAVEELKREVVL